MLVDITEFLEDKVLGPLYALLFVATLVTGLVAWTERRARRWLVRRRFAVTDDALTAVRTPLTRYRWTLLAVLLPAVFGVPYLTGAAYVVPLVVDRVARSSRLGGVEATPPYGPIRALIGAVGLAVVIGAAGAAILAGTARGHEATVVAWFAGLGVGGLIVAELAARVRYPPPAPPDAPIAVVATVDRRMRWAALGGGLYLALLGTGKACETAATALVTQWQWRDASIDTLRLARPALTAVGVAVLVVVGFVVPAADGGRH